MTRPGCRVRARLHLRGTLLFDNFEHRFVAQMVGASEFIDGFTRAAWVACISIADVITARVCDGMLGCERIKSIADPVLSGRIKK